MVSGECNVCACAEGGHVCVSAVVFAVVGVVLCVVSAVVFTVVGVVTCVYQL